MANSKWRMFIRSIWEDWNCWNLHGCISSCIDVHFRVWELLVGHTDAHACETVRHTYSWVTLYVQRTLSYLHWAESRPSSEHSFPMPWSWLDARPAYPIAVGGLQRFCRVPFSLHLSISCSLAPHDFLPESFRDKLQIVSLSKLQ